MKQSIRSQLLPYGVAVAAVLLALLLTLMLHRWTALDIAPFLLFHGAVMISAWYGGLRPGLFATFLSALVSSCFLLLPAYDFIFNWFYALPIGLYVLQGIVISLLCERLWVEKRRAERNLLRVEASEERFRLILSNSNISIFQQDQALRYLWIYTPGGLASIPEIIDKSDYDLFPIAEADQLTAIKQQVLNSGTPERKELCLTTYRDSAHRETRFYDLIVQPLRTKSGSIEGVNCIALNITERKLVEQQLQAETERNSSILESITDAFIAVDQQWKFTYINRHFEKLVQRSRQEILGQCIWDLFPEMIDSDFYREYHRSMVQQVPANVEVLWRGGSSSGALGTDGLREHQLGQWLETRAYPSTEGISIYFQDITVRKQAELENSHLQDKLRQALRHQEESLALLNTWLMSSPVALAFIDSELRYVHVNEALATLNGLPVSQHLGRTVQDVLPDWAAQLEPILSRVMQTKEPLLNQEMNSETNPPGLYRCSLMSYQPVCLPDGQLLGVGVTGIDITDRKRFQKELEESEAHLRLAVEGAALGMWDYDLRSGQLIWSDRCKAVFGLAPDIEMTYEIFINAVHPDDRQRVNQAVQQAITNRENYDVEIRTVWDQKPLRWVRSIGQSYYDEQNQPTRMAGVVLDITERKRSQAEQEDLLQREQAARTEAEQANRIKDEFLAVLSHELRSPLNPILGWAKLLRSRPFDEAARNRALEIIERNAKLQAQLIEDLLDVSRILRGKISLNMASVNLAAPIQGAVETVRLAAEAKSIQIQLRLSSEVENVLGDAGRLQQIVWNLLSNAVKFTPAGGQIEVCLEPIDSQAQITVSDTGKGINPNFLPHVFDHFRQADSTTTRKFGGLGLGLAIVRHLVELHGGTVWVESLGEGKGSTFTVKLPLLKDDGNKYENEFESISSGGSYAASLLRGVRVLAVDDEKDMRDYVAYVLRQFEAEVAIVASAHEVLELLPQFKPDILLSDIGMPGMDGYTLLRQIRMLMPEQGKNLLAIALTAYAAEYDQKQARSAGFQLHLAKPVEPDQLVKAIADLVKTVKK